MTLPLFPSFSHSSSLRAWSITGPTERATAGLWQAVRQCLLLTTDPQGSPTGSTQLGSTPTALSLRPPRALRRFHCYKETSLSDQIPSKSTSLETLLLFPRVYEIIIDFRMWMLHSWVGCICWHYSKFQKYRLRISYISIQCLDQTGPIPRIAIVLMSHLRSPHHISLPLHTFFQKPIEHAQCCHYANGGGRRTGTLVA